jgi:signal transduction histidine kinase
LGLPVTKALVDANRARLVLSSEPGVGTSADVIFPADRLFTSAASA